MIYLSPTEHDLQRIIPSDTYKISSICEANGVDIIAPTPKGFVGFQRKSLPDLKASLVDGRLYKELAQIRASRVIVYPFLVLEANLGRITTSGDYLDADISQSTLWSVLAKCQLLGTHYLNSTSLTTTYDLIVSVSQYLARGSFESLKRANSPTSAWGDTNNRDYLIYLYQSFPGVGPTTAAAIADFFSSPPIAWRVDARELSKVPGIGKKRAQQLIDVLGEL